MQDSGAAPLTANPLRKLAVLAPLAMSGAAAVALTATAAAAWGAADSLGFEAWVPTVASLMMSLPVLALSLYAFRAVWSRMSGLFEVDMFGAVVGAASHWVAAVCLVIFTGTMGSEESYESLGAESTSSGGFMFLVVVAMLIGMALHGGLTMVYIWAVTPGRKTRISERGGEDDIDFLDNWTQRRPRT
jgi:hypothetical protein